MMAAAVQHAPGSPWLSIFIPLHLPIGDWPRLAALPFKVLTNEILQASLVSIPQSTASDDSATQAGISALAPARHLNACPVLMTSSAGVWDPKPSAGL